MAAVTDVEPLGGRIEVMELECALATRVPTDDAATARLFNQLPLDDSSMSPRRFRSTPHASVVATALKHELSVAMPQTAPFDLRSITNSTRLPAPNRLKAKFVQPVTNRRRALAQLLRDLAQSQPLAHQRLQYGPADLTFGRMLGSAARFKAMLLQPIADCRRVLADQLADCVKR